MRMTNRNVKISPFRYWCQQTLPLTFDDSLSYMELLSKVIKHLNDCVADVATAEQDIINLHNAFVQLQGYVNEYFQNLNVQSEVDHKIDEMVENGTFDQLLDPIVGSQIAGVVADQIGDVVAGQIGDVVAGQIGDVVEEQLPVVVNQQLETVVGEQVTEWLEENIDPTTMPVVDPTLSIHGAAADAKETGDRFRSIGVYHPNVIDANLFSVPYSYDDTWDEGDIIPTHLNTFQVSESGWYAVVARFKWGANMTVNDWNVMPALYRASDNTRLNISGAVPSLNSKATFGQDYATIVGVWHAVAFLDEDLKLGFHFYNGSTAIYLDFEVSDYALIKFDSSDELYEWADNNCPNVDGYYTPVSNGVFVVTADVESPSLIAKFAELEEENEELRQELIDSYVTDSATGAIASFPDGADNIPVKDLKVAIEPVQSGSGDPSPDNIRPISGWNGANVYRIGKNLFNIADLWANGTTATSGGESNKYIDIPVPVGTTATCSTNVPNNTNPSVASVMVEGNANNTTPPSSTSGVFLNTPRTVTSTDGYIRIHIRTASSSYLAWNEQSFAPYYIQLELGSTATDYEPYNGNTYPISWQTEAGTVYGGTLDVTTGVLTGTHEIVDMGDLSWSSYMGAFYANIVGKNYLNQYANVICSCYATYPENFNNASTAGNTLSNGQIAGFYRSSGTSTDSYVYVKDTAYNDPTAFKTAVTGQKIVYELATPITYQLTPTEVSTVLGQNNIWANCGDVDVEYRADTKLYIQKVIA